jgi:hypothetical protein
MQGRRVLNTQGKPQSGKRLMTSLPVSDVTMQTPETIEAFKS